MAGEHRSSTSLCHTEPSAKWDPLIWRHFLHFLSHQEMKCSCLHSVQSELVWILLTSVINPPWVMRRKEQVWRCALCPARWSYLQMCGFTKMVRIPFGGQEQPTCPIKLKEWSWKISFSITSAYLAHQTGLRIFTWGSWASVLWLDPLFHLWNGGQHKIQRRAAHPSSFTGTLNPGWRNY